MKRLNPLMELSRSEIENLVDEYIIGLNAERDRKILKRRLIDGITYEKLSEENDLSTIGIKNIVKKRQNELFKHLK